jgi:dGTPase
VPRYREIHEAVETQFPGATERERFHEALRQLIDLLVSGLIEGTVAAAEGSGAAGCDDVRAYPERLARFTPEAGETSRALKRFLFARVYASDALGSDRRISMARIAELFRFFLASPERLPQPYAQQAIDEPPHHVVCDYIAGMTDGFFDRTYQLMLQPEVNPRLS